MVGTLVDTVYTACIRFAVSCVSVYYPEDVVREDEKREIVRDPVPELPPPPRTFKAVSEILQTAPISADVHHTVMYAKNHDIPVYANPTVEFDSEIGSIPYGEMVMMLEPKGRFLKVMWGTLSGWVMKDDVADRAAFVYPTFTVGEEHGHAHENTIRVRSILGDPFRAYRLELALQAGEYVLYKLWRKGKKIVWGEKSGPRVPGLWHTILKGREGVHMGVVPKVGTVMEYVMENDAGHVAYVDAVYPDNAISISEANYPDRGIYNERVLTKEEWRELRPTFITVL